VRECRTLGSARGAARKGGPYRNWGLLPLRVVLPRNAHQRASRSMGDAEVQTAARPTNQGMGLARCCPTAPPRSLRPLAHASKHQQPTCGGRMRREPHVRSCESGRVRFPPATHQNLMSGLMGGSWRRGSPAGHLRVPGRCAGKCHHDGLVGTQLAGHLQPRQLPTRLRFGNSARHFDKVRNHAIERLALVVAKRHHRSRGYGWSVVCFQSPNHLGLIDLNGIVVAPRPFRAWRGRPNTGGERRR
jgi:RNA-directed DNA polymerase